MCDHARFDYTVITDYATTPDEFISSGGFVSASDGVASLIPPTLRTGRTELTVTLFRFDASRITTGKVLRCLRRLGYRPAEPAELLAFAAQHKEVQRCMHVVSLFPGIVHEECPVALGLTADDDGRSVCAFPWDGAVLPTFTGEKPLGAWTDAFCFAAVPDEFLELGGELEEEDGTPCGCDEVEV